MAFLRHVFIAFFADYAYFASCYADDAAADAFAFAAASLFFHTPDATLIGQVTFSPDIAGERLLRR